MGVSRWKVDGGEDLDESFIREVFEETGLITAPKSGLGYIDHDHIPKGPYQGIPYLAIFRAAYLICGKLKLSDEHIYSDWVPEKDIVNFELTPQTRRAIYEIRKFALKSLL